MTIVRITAEAANMPVPQWAKIRRVQDLDHIDVELLGAGERLTIKFSDIIGVKLTNRFSLLFRPTGYEQTKTFEPR